MASENYRAPSVTQSAELAEQQGVEAVGDQLLDELRDVEDYFNDVEPNPIHLATVQAAISALAATGKQQVGEVAVAEQHVLPLAREVLAAQCRSRMEFASERDIKTGRNDANWPELEIIAHALRHPHYMERPEGGSPWKPAAQVGEVQGDALSLAEHITDHLCHHEYDIGGRSELLACVTQALAAQAGQGAVPCATSASHALRVAYRHLDMVSMRVSHCKDAAIIESAMKDVDTFDLNAAISALAARQPGAQEPVGFQIMRRSADDTCFNGRWDNPPSGFHDDREYYVSRPGTYRVRDIYAAPPAQGIDLGQQRPLIARSLAEWHENDGNVMWWAWCGRGWAGEPAWCGTPNDSDWPGYHTHWTQHPSQPALIDQRDAAPGVGNG